jgi:uncharacterized protein YkwD
MNNALPNWNAVPATTKRFAGFCAVVLLIMVASSMPSWYRPHITEGGNRAAALQAMLNDLNAHRTAQGLGPLTFSSKLDYAALQHADDMIAKDYFDHVSPSGSTPFTRMHADGIHYVWAGENIAESDSQTTAEQALWESPEHRANILNPHYKHVGISISSRPDGELVFVQEFTN